MLKKIASDFPILTHPLPTLKGKRLAYLDNAATTQKPQVVIDAMTRYYQTANANVHRGIHALSTEATELFEQARKMVQRFIHAKHPYECIFTKNTTEAINLVAFSFGEAFLKPGDEILISAFEHHSNIVPWQLVCERKGAHLKVIPMNQAGELVLDDLEKLLTTKTKLVAVTHVSNALGTLNPIEKLIEAAHRQQIPVLVDGAQSVPHLPIDVQALDCDFFTFTGHKMYGPTGIGVLYGKEAWLEKLPPYQGGGEMVLTVSLEKMTYNELPFKFEAGTPPIAEAIGLAAALNYLNCYDRLILMQQEAALLASLLERLASFPHIQLIGTPRERIGIVSFVREGIHPHDIGTLLNEEGIAVRTGHHCAMPVMSFYGTPGTVRASLGIYNTEEDVEQLIKGMEKVHKVFS